MNPPKLFLVEIRVRDWNHAIAWYRDVLGLSLVWLDEGNRFALLDAGPARLALKGSESPGGREAVDLLFQVDDLDAERRRLAEWGVVVPEPIENREERYREIRLADPEGTPIRLFAWWADDDGSVSRRGPAKRTGLSE